MKEDNEMSHGKELCVAQWVEKVSSKMSEMKNGLSNSWQKCQRVIEKRRLQLIITEKGKKHWVPFVKIVAQTPQCKIGPSSVQRGGTNGPCTSFVDAILGQRFIDKFINKYEPTQRIIDFMGSSSDPIHHKLLNQIQLMKVFVATILDQKHMWKFNHHEHEDEDIHTPLFCGLHKLSDVDFKAPKNINIDIQKPSTFKAQPTSSSERVLPNQSNILAWRVGKKKSLKYNRYESSAKTRYFSNIK